MKITIYSTLLLCFMCCFTKNNFAKDNDSTKTNLIDSIESEIFDRAEVMPTFPGGVGKLMSYLVSNLKYPAEAKQFKFEGKVIVKFYIDIDGTVREPIVLGDNVGGGADIEAIRLVTAMPKWNPGTQRGKPVKCHYTLPIRFKLN